MPCSAPGGCPSRGCCRALETMIGGLWAVELPGRGQVVECGPSNLRLVSLGGRGILRAPCFFVVLRILKNRNIVLYKYYIGFTLVLRLEPGVGQVGRTGLPGQGWWSAPPQGAVRSGDGILATPVKCEQSLSVFCIKVAPPTIPDSGFRGPPESCGEEEGSSPRLGSRTVRSCWS